MILKEALEKLKEGQYITIGNDMRADWTEYSVQYTMIEGKIHWTAGGTCGGIVSDVKLEQLKNQISHTSCYSIYNTFKGRKVE